MAGTLRQILLDGTSVTSKSVLCLLENLPHLVNVDSSLMEKFLLSMQHFFQNSTDLGHINNCIFFTNFYLTDETGGNYKLKTLKLCIRKHTEVTPSIAQLIPILFPNLEDLVIHHVHPREFESLVHLGTLSKLHSFMIGKFSLLSKVFFIWMMN